MRKIVRKNDKNPWFFIPTQYFAEGLPFVIVNQLTTALYKSLGASNEFIGITSFFYLPWSLKFIWSPLVEANSSKRRWILVMQSLLTILFALLSLVIKFDNYIIYSLIIFSLIAIISSTHDIATDGYYLFQLDKKNQALFSGIRSAFYRLSMITGSGLFVWLAGYLGDKYGSIKNGWSLTFLAGSFIFIIIFFYHLFILPEPENTDKQPLKTIFIPYRIIFKDYFSQPGIVLSLSFILLYRFGEGMALKMAQPFFLDGLESGGLNLKLTEVGLIYGTFGVIALMLGGIAGGWLIKKYSLNKLFMFLALCMNLPNILFIYLSVYRPLELVSITIFGFHLSLHLNIIICVILEQFGYGFGFTAYMVFLIYFSKGTYKTTFYAISTGLMAVGMMIPGFLSGFIQSSIGYKWLFVISCLCALPGLLIIPYLPNVEEK